MACLFVYGFLPFSVAFACPLLSLVGHEDVMASSNFEIRQSRVARGIPYSFSTCFGDGMPDITIFIVKKCSGICGLSKSFLYNRT